LNKVSRTRSGVGRTPAPDGVGIRCPRQQPAIIRTPPRPVVDCLPDSGFFFRLTGPILNNFINKFAASR
jgi:hypothetical protein